METICTIKVHEGKRWQKREMTLDEYYDLKDSGPRNGIEATAAVREFALAQTKAFTKRQAMEACRIKSMKWMSNALVSLQREGVIKKPGESKDARYRLQQPRKV